MSSAGSAIREVATIVVRINGTGFEVKRTNNFGFVFKERKGIKAKVFFLLMKNKNTNLCSLNSTFVLESNMN